MTPSLDAVALLPEIVLTATIAVALVIDLLVGDDKKRWVAIASAIGTLAALAAVVMVAIDGRTATMAGGVYVVDDFSLLAKGILLTSTAVVFLFGLPAAWKGDYCVLILSSLLGMLLVSSSRDLLTFFVAFELLAIPGYMLVGWNKRSEHGHEAALKYYLLGVVATAVLLYGLSLLYGIAGSTLFDDIAVAMADDANDTALARLGVFFVLVGMAFKVSAVPFHFWAPDAYQGAPLPVAAFLSVASKVAGMVALLQLTAVAFPDAASVWAPLVWGLAALSMTAGNLIALRQTDMVRLLAYSSIAQAGYLLVPLAVAGPFGGTLDTAIESTFMFMLIYAAMNLGAFAVVIAVSRHSADTSIAGLSGLFWRMPVMATLLAVFLLALAGIPPLGGWFAKLVIFRAAVEAGSTEAIVLAAVVAVNTAIGLVYYALVVRRMWLPDAGSQVAEPTASEVRPDRALIAGLALTTSAILVSGVLPGIVSHLGGLSSLGS